MRSWCISFGCGTCIVLVAVSAINALQQVQQERGVYKDKFLQEESKTGRMLRTAEVLTRKIFTRRR